MSVSYLVHMLKICKLVVLTAAQKLLMVWLSCSEHANALLRVLLTLTFGPWLSDHDI